MTRSRKGQLGCSVLAFLLLALLLCAVAPSRFWLPIRTHVEHLWQRYARSGERTLAERRGTPRRQWIREFARAVYLYASHHEGRVPYSDKGSDAALYLLKDLIEFPNTPSYELEEMLVFDDDRQLLLNCPYEYLNPRDQLLKDLDPTLILLAEKALDSDGGRLCADAAGATDYLHSSKERLVGTHRAPSANGTDGSP